MQVVSLQAQLACLKEQAAQCLNNNMSTTNPNEKFLSYNSSYCPNDVQSWFHSENSNTNPQFDPYYGKGSIENNNNFQYFGENNNIMMSSSSNSDQEQMMECFVERETEKEQWGLADDDEMDDLQSVAFRYIHHQH